MSQVWPWEYRDANGNTLTVGPGVDEGTAAMGDDPTRIELAADPRTARLTGVSIHGLVPFNVPFVSEIAPNLWQGGCADGLVLPGHIRHLVSLYPWEHYTVRHELASALAVRMTDSTDQDPGQIPVIAAWVNTCRKDGPVLVHCQAGLNRSSLVVAMALMLEGSTADEAIALIREKRSPACLCNPEFENWLRSHDSAPVSLTAPLDGLWPAGAKGIATRTRNNLLRAGLKTVGDVAACRPADLLGLREFGHGSLREVERVLAAAGLQLQEEAA